MAYTGTGYTTCLERWGRNWGGKGKGGGGHARKDTENNGAGRKSGKTAWMIFLKCHLTHASSF